MADNYLEKRMDDYARGRLASRPAQHRQRGVVYPRVRVLVADIDGVPGLHDFVATLADAGHAVMFTTAGSGGVALAQKCGARYYPMTPAEAAADSARRGETLDVAILLGGTPSSRRDIMEEAGIAPGLWITVSDDGDDIACADVIALPAGRAAALLALALMHPALSSTSPRFRVRSGD